MNSVFRHIGWFVIFSLLFSYSYADDDKRAAYEKEKQRILRQKRLKLKRLRAKKAQIEEEKEAGKVPKQFSLHDLHPVLRYAYTTDINEQTDALDGANALSLALSHQIGKRTSLFSGVSVAYETVGSSVFRPSPNDDFFKISDLYIGAGYRADIKAPLMLNFGGSLGLPLSDRSRFEGFDAILSLSGSLNHLLPKYKNLTAGIGGSFDYIFNTFEFSPTTGSTQPESRGSFSATIAYRLPYGFRYIGTIWSRLTLFVDNSTLTRFGNSHTLFWTRKNISLYMSYSNADTPERGATDFWFIDDYRKIFTVGIVARALAPTARTKKRRVTPFNQSVFEEE